MRVFSGETNRVAHAPENKNGDLWTALVKRPKVQCGTRHEDERPDQKPEHKGNKKEGFDPPDAATAHHLLVNDVKVRIRKGHPVMIKLKVFWCRQNDPPAFSSKQRAVGSETFFDWAIIHGSRWKD